MWGDKGFVTRVFWRRHLSHALLTRVGKDERTQFIYLLESGPCSVLNPTVRCSGMIWTWGVKDNPEYGTNEEDMIRQKTGD